jgi:hypothetical protein
LTNRYAANKISFFARGSSRRNESAVTGRIFG